MSIGFGGEMTRQKFASSVPAGQLKNDDRSSTFSAIEVSCASVSLVLPLPFWAHCAAHQPTVRGQLLLGQVIVVGASAWSVVCDEPFEPAQSATTSTLFVQVTCV